MWSSNTTPFVIIKCDLPMHRTNNNPGQWNTYCKTLLYSTITIFHEGVEGSRLLRASGGQCTTKVFLQALHAHGRNLGMVRWRRSDHYSHPPTSKFFLNNESPTNCILCESLPIGRPVVFKPRHPLLTPQPRRAVRKGLWQYRKDKMGQPARDPVHGQKVM